jgi:hypothetical protein
MGYSFSTGFGGEFFLAPKLGMGFGFEISYGSMKDSDASDVTWQGLVGTLALTITHN